MEKKNFTIPNEIMSVGLSFRTMGKKYLNFLPSQGCCSDAHAFSLPKNEVRYNFLIRFTQ